MSDDESIGEYLMKMKGKRIKNKRIRSSKKSSEYLCDEDAPSDDPSEHSDFENKEANVHTPRTRSRLALSQEENNIIQPQQETCKKPKRSFAGKENQISKKNRKLKLSEQILEKMDQLKSYYSSIDDFHLEVRTK